jgi:hypothetical protein
MSRYRVSSVDRSIYTKDEIYQVNWIKLSQKTEKVEDVSYVASTRPIGTDMSGPPAIRTASAPASAAMSAQPGTVPACPWYQRSYSQRS